VQPRELARKLAKEMESYKTVSVSRIYVPNEYTVFLSREDRRQFEGYEQSLLDELSAYLLEHAANENLALLTRPKVAFETDRRLRMGEFGIQARLVKPPEEAGAQVSQGALGATMVYSAAQVKREQAEPRETDKPKSRALLIWDGRSFVIDRPSAVIGRSKRCDFVVDDANVSRRHCELSLKDGDWFIADLQSTNGVAVNGRSVSSTRLAPGDEITLGTAKLRFDVD
jgi:predicted component of type VI protein secretion system